MDGIIPTFGDSNSEAIQIIFGVIPTNLGFNWLGQAYNFQTLPKVPQYQNKNLHHFDFPDQSYLKPFDQDGLDFGKAKAMCILRILFSFFLQPE